MAKKAEHGKGKGEGGAKESRPAAEAPQAEAQVGADGMLPALAHAAGHSDEPKSYFDRKRAARRLQTRLMRRAPEEEANFLNITPMMDMMTIILVFFLKSASTNVQQMTTAQGLELAKSSTSDEPNQGVTVTLSSDAIMVEDREVVRVTKGRVDASAKRDGDTGYFITPVWDALEQHHQRLVRLEELSKGAQPFRGEITVVCDKKTPYRLVSEVLYTAGQAKFARYRLIVSKKNAEG